MSRGEKFRITHFCNNIPPHFFTNYLTLKDNLIVYILEHQLTVATHCDLILSSQKWSESSMRVPVLLSNSFSCFSKYGRVRFFMCIIRVGVFLAEGGLSARLLSAASALTIFCTSSLTTMVKQYSLKLPAYKFKISHTYWD